MPRKKPIKPEPVTYANPVTYTPKSVHCFFDACEGIDYEPELRLLLKWISWWTAKGYEPRVLNRSHAEAHPLYAEFLRKVDTFPTVNPPEYERACWLRWLAFHQVGAGFMGDYDCFCRGDRAKGEEPVAFDAYSGSLILFEGHRENACPSLVSASPDAVRAFIDWILTLPDGYAPAASQGHFSDMIALREYPALQTVPLVKQYTEPGYQTAAFVHCSHGSTHADARPRHKHIDRIMAMKEVA